jgi:hypothetical protein
VLPLNGHEYKKTSFLIGGKFRHFDIAIGKGNVKNDGIING